MPITLPPATPSRNRPTAFSAEMDAYLAWLSAAIPEMNSIATGSINAGTFNTLVANAYTGAGRRSLGGLASAISGTANAIVLTQTGFSTLLVNQEVVFKATSANTGATTINLDGTGAIACVTMNGAALPSGYIRTDTITRARYNGTNWVVDREPEYGSNSDGEYWRYADGKQECSIEVNNDAVAWTTADGSFFRAASTATWNYPKPFASGARPAFSFGVSIASRLGGVSYGAIYNSSLLWYGWASTSAAAGVTKLVSLSVTGRWY